MTGEVDRNAPPAVADACTLGAIVQKEAEAPKNVEELNRLKSTLASIKGEELPPSLQAKVDKFLKGLGDPANPKLEPGTKVAASMLLNEIQEAMKMIKIAQKMLTLLGKISAFIGSPEFEAAAAKVDANAGKGSTGPHGVRAPAEFTAEGWKTGVGNLKSWLVGNVQTAFTVAIMLLAELQKEITADNTKLALLQRDLQVEMRNIKMDQQMQKAITNKNMLLDQANAAVAYAATQAALAGVSLALTVYASGIEQKPQMTKPTDGSEPQPIPKEPGMQTRDPETGKIIMSNVKTQDVLDKNNNPVHKTDYSRAVDTVSQSIGGFGGASDKFIQAGYQTKLAAFDQMITLMDDIYQAASKQQDKNMQYAQKAQDMLQQMLDQLMQWHDRVTQIHVSQTGN